MTPHKVRTYSNGAKTAILVALESKPGGRPFHHALGKTLAPIQHPIGAVGSHNRTSFGGRFEEVFGKVKHSLVDVTPRSL